MAQFRVTAVTKDGETYTEVVEAKDRFTVFHDLRARGDRVVEVDDETEKKTFSLNNLNFDIPFFSGVSMDEKVIFTRNMAAMIEAGLTVSRALGVMERQSKNSTLKKALGGMIGDVKSGLTLSAAFQKHTDIFPRILISMVRAGEESGGVSDALRVVSKQMERSSQLTKKIRGAMIYPSIVVTAMIGIGILMLIFVVPTLTQTFKEVGVTLPATTRAIIFVSDFLVQHTLIALAALAVFVVAMIATFRSRVGRRVRDAVVVRMPVIGTIMIETYAARTLRTLSSLLTAGVDVIFSISITKDVLESEQYKKVMQEAEASVATGGAISKIFLAHPLLYPPLVAEMAAVGEETGKLSDMLRQTAEFYEESVEQQTKDLSTIIEPLLMLVIGGGVGFFAISMIAPIYSLSSGI